MKKILIVAAVVALGACNQKEAAPAPEPTEEAAAPAGPLAADGKPSVGKYTVTTADGEVYTETVNADGTYTSTDKDGKVSETGKWVQKSPTVYCTTKDGKDSKEVCNTEGIDASGKWTSTNPDTKKTATVVRIEG